MKQSLADARKYWRQNLKTRHESVLMKAMREDPLSEQESEDLADLLWSLNKRVESSKGNAAHKEMPPRGVRFEASASGDSTDVYLYDEIGYWGVTAKDFQAQLAGVSTPNICLHINSPGGDVFDGIAIYSALKAHPAHVTTIVDGLAASAASFIALAGDKVCMAENAFMMIHNAWGVAMGNKAEMLDMASTLGKLDGQLASIYAAKTGKTQEECAALMNGDVDGTWFTAHEAQDCGLIDMIDPDGEEEPDPEDPNEREEPDEENAAKNATIQRMRMRLRLAETA